jgi:Na+-transporting methylmalonyl-CoA/oxaloacetate decarboxylase gamma subunit
MTDWGQAGFTGGVGFATVFVVLSVLALVVWATGLILSKMANRQTTKKGE